MITRIDSDGIAVPVSRMSTPHLKNAFMKDVRDGCALLYLELHKSDFGYTAYSAHVGPHLWEFVDREAVEAMANEMLIRGVRRVGFDPRGYVERMDILTRCRYMICMLRGIEDCSFPHGMGQRDPFITFPSRKFLPYVNESTFGEKQ